jgi:macrolide-specific efflux system membrane fusion protein
VYVQVGDYVTTGQLLADLAILPDLETQWAQVSADAKYENTISNNTIRRAEIDLQIAQLNLADLTARGVNQNQIQIAQLQVELAQMNLDEIKANPTLHTAAVKAKQLEQQMQNAQLLAPISGYIIEAPNSGRAVKKTVAAFTIGDISQLEVGASVTDEVLKQLTEGQVVTVTLEAQTEKQFVGTIRLLPYPYGSGKESSGDSMVRVTLNETPEQGGYKLGDRMVIAAVLQRRTNILWLPPQAIRTVGVRTFVAVEDASGQQQRVEVTLGLQTYTQVEIVSGLKEGQVVIGP